MALPQVGAPAPVFTLHDQDGVEHSLTDYRGKWLLIYFYPRDNTAGCATEASGMRDEFQHFEKIGATVLGVSTDSVKSHKKFADAYRLPFTLLSDERKEMVNAYGVWSEKKFMGRVYLGTVRTSFLVNPEGTIVKIYEKVKPKIHAGEVIADLQHLVK